MPSMPATKVRLSGVSSCAEYQQADSVPIASSPICCRIASSTAVMPPQIGVVPPYSLNCLKNRKPFDPANDMKMPSKSGLNWATNVP